MSTDHLQVPTVPAEFENLDPHHDFDSADWKRANRYGIMPSGSGIQIYCQPRTRKQIRALRDTLNNLLVVWQGK
jgi:hypothetical protein